LRTIRPPLFMTKNDLWPALGRTTTPESFHLLASGSKMRTSSKALNLTCFFSFLWALPVARKNRSKKRAPGLRPPTTVRPVAVRQATVRQAGLPAGEGRVACRQHFPEFSREQEAKRRRKTPFGRLIKRSGERRQWRIRQMGRRLWQRRQRRQWWQLWG
jgi:hypothetical protein